ncbi:hypothetical protein [Polaribacter aestuariivivens]|uniref:hypothetical protein n=1 Tax=Polaribacter aestuariivivens TaxID=2304626 RepID=UPI003F49AD9B
MSKLILKGDTEVLERIAKSLRLKAKRNDIEVSLIKKEKGKEKPEGKTTTEDKKTHWKEVVASVNEAKTLENLVPFESDERASVIKAVAERKLELESI